MFTVSATVGTSLEMKCDAVRNTDYTWRRNGELLTDNTDNKIKVRTSCFNGQKNYWHFHGFKYLYMSFFQCQVKAL